MGKPTSWDKAEEALVTGLSKRNIPYFIGEGEAAFYGPKIDIMVKDAIGREWQLTTVQLDFNQPENFDMKYVSEEGKDERPAVLHIAILGSFDRFIAVLIEHYAGSFPLWLAPVQVMILPISDKHIPYSKQVYEELRKNNIRVELNEEPATIGKKIRQATLQKDSLYGYNGGSGSGRVNHRSTKPRRKRSGKTKINEFVQTLKTTIEKYVS